MICGPFIVPKVQQQNSTVCLHYITLIEHCCKTTFTSCLWHLYLSSNLISFLPAYTACCRHLSSNVEHQRGSWRHNKISWDNCSCTWALGAAGLKYQFWMLLIGTGYPYISLNALYFAEWAARTIQRPSNFNDLLKCCEGVKQTFWSHETARPSYISAIIKCSNYFIATTNFVRHTVCWSCSTSTHDSLDSYWCLLSNNTGNARSLFPSWKYILSYIFPTISVLLYEWHLHITKRLSADVI